MKTALAAIDAVEQGTADALTIALDLAGAAAAVVLGVAQKTTGPGVHGGDEHESRREGE